MTPPDHDCAWREEAERLQSEVADLKSRFNQLEHLLKTTHRRHLGPKSERMPGIDKAMGTRADPEETQRKRRESKAARSKLPKEVIVHPVPPEERHCPKCGGHELKSVGAGRVTSVVEYVPPKFILQEHIQETLSCPCGEHIVTAKAPRRVFEKSSYGPGFIAHLITAKCADTIPIYRQVREYQRLGIPISRSTMTDLFHQAARELAPLALRNLELIAKEEVVHGDETSMRVQAKGKCRNGFVWTFRSGKKIGFWFAPTRSGDVPVKVLGETEGTLIVDGYSGYNQVTTPGKRQRAGCHAHARRYLFDALPTAPEAEKGLEIILDLYRVEYEAQELGIVGTAAHLRLRKKKSKAIREKLRQWLESEQPKHLPKSPMGVAIRYILGPKNWKALGRFLEDARVPLDNNPAESALRRLALGRRVYMFVGNDQAGQDLACLQSLVASCEAHGLNPTQYLADVLMRVQWQPQSQLEDLLPQNWRPPG